MRKRRAMVVALVTALATVAPALPLAGAAGAEPHSAIPTCRWASLDLALGQPTGGGLSPRASDGYTLLIVNTGSVACSVKGYPIQLELSNRLGEPLRVSVRHRADSLFAQPRPTAVRLGHDQVASFGFSYTYLRRVPTDVPPKCLATELDVRLPARGSSLFSDFWVVGLDVCATSRVVEVTPVERGAVPAPGRRA